jgi:hypothetical protein
MTRSPSFHPILILQKIFTDHFSMLHAFVNNQRQI